jgi:hypothetical protein
MNESTRVEFESMPLLHAWGQAIQHDSLLLVGNRAGLLALRAAIDAALEAPLDCDGQAIAKGPEPAARPPTSPEREETQ